MDTTQESGLNDFVVKFANVNGTGSASANGLLMKAIFRMGVPVSAKNFFPSNIQGLPTWFEIRVNRDARIARSGRVDVMVAMNAQTYAQDLAELSAGGALIYDSTWPREKELARDDIQILGFPFAGMCNAAFDNPRTRILMKNVAYLGALVALLDVDMDVVRGLLDEIYGRKPKLVEANMKAIELGHNYAREHFECPLATRIEAMNATSESILIDGNTAAAIGCLYAGATFAAWYPITPSTSLMEAFRSLCARYRTDPASGENRFCIVQAEDEIGALGMVAGASWAGARAFTSTSGPGISLMQETLGFGYFAEIPLVLFDIQRVGPSTGMPTRTQQGDLLACALASHGDTRHVLLLPADPRECFELAVTAFDLADRLQTPVIVLSDLDIGMNEWMCEKLEWDAGYRPDRGKVLDASALAELNTFYRYLDQDGDGICYRSYPGVHPKGAYFTRGSGHNERASYTEDASEYRDLVLRLERKLDTARGMVPKPIVRNAEEKTPYGIVSFGSCDAAVREAIERLAEEGFALDYLRVRALPFSREVAEFISHHKLLFVVEQNRDAQLRTLILADTNAPAEKLTSILHFDGMPIDFRCIFDGIHQKIERSVAA